MDMNIKVFLCTWTGIIGGVIASLFGGWDTALQTLVIFMAIDYITGLVVAGVFHASPKTKTGALESKAGWKGLIRKGETLLSAAGKPLLPIDNAQLEQMISAGFTVGAALAAWWKNNSFTQAALAGDEEYERAKKRVMK